jgi:hypothetical protein
MKNYFRKNRGFIMSWLIVLLFLAGLLYISKPAYPVERSFGSPNANQTAQVPWWQFWGP